MSRGNTGKFSELESKFESLLMVWVTKHEIKLASTFCKNWEPTRANTNKLEFWKQEEELQKWKIIDYIAVPIEWSTKSAVARDCRAQNLTDHWPMVTYVKLPHKKESWKYRNNFILKGWKPKKESDEAGFGRMIVGSLEDAQDLMGVVSIEDITKKLPMAAGAVEFESTRRRNRLVKKTRENLAAEKNLRGKEVRSYKLPNESYPSKEENMKPGEYCRRH